MQVDFYALTRPTYRDRPLLAVAILCRKAFRARQSVLVLADGIGQAEELDELLWSFEPDSFLAHQLAGDEDDARCPILIAPPDQQPEGRAVVINLRPEASTHRCERILELIPDSEAAKVAARQRWRHYQARGLEPRRVDI